MAVNLKTATPDTTLPTSGFLFGADSQSASAPSVYPMSALFSLLFGSTSFSGSAANTLVLSDGATAQNFHVYNTYTDASNYERGVFDWTTAPGGLTIGTKSAGTGGNRPLQFIINGVNKLDHGYSLGGAWTFASPIIVPTVRTSNHLVMDLPSASSVGAGTRAFVTDANSTTFLSTVAGGGANKVPVVSDGTNWLIG